MSKDIIEKMDCLVENSSSMLIDFLPRKMISEGYFKLEEYFLENYLHDFAKKISTIIIKLINYYPSEIYKVRFIDDEIIVSEDYALKEICEIINIINSTIFKEDNTSSNLQIILNGEDTFLIRIDCEFSVNLYNASKDDLELISMLVMQEGLFIREIENQ